LVLYVIEPFLTQEYIKSRTPARGCTRRGGERLDG
jgi:hypothetical protein